MGRRSTRSPKPCSAPGCESPARARSLCANHYEYARRVHGLEVLPVRTLAERLAARLKPSPTNSYQGTACLEWQGSLSKAGYGTIGANGTPVLAHRVAYQQHHNVVLTSEQLVCHHCDNPPCCNPAHLFVGTNADNMADMAAKGRSARGSRNGMAKLSEAEVLAIRAAFGAGLSRAEVAQRFGLSIGLTDRIIYRQRWAWLT